MKEKSAKEQDEKEIDAVKDGPTRDSSMPVDANAHDANATQKVDECVEVLRLSRPVSLESGVFSLSLSLPESRPYATPHPTVDSGRASEPHLSLHDFAQNY